MPTTLERKMIQKDLQREIEELRRENIFLENRILDAIETKSQSGSFPRACVYARHRASLIYFNPAVLATPKWRNNSPAQYSLFAGFSCLGRV